MLLHKGTSETFERELVLLPVVVTTRQILRLDSYERIDRIHTIEEEVSLKEEKVESLELSLSLSVAFTVGSFSGL